jgi:hypothetical protein
MSGRTVCGIGVFIQLCHERYLGIILMDERDGKKIEAQDDQTHHSSPNKKHIIDV